MQRTDIRLALFVSVTSCEVEAESREAAGKPRGWALGSFFESVGLKSPALSYLRQAWHERSVRHGQAPGEAERAFEGLR